MEIVTDRTEYEILSILDRKNRVVTSSEIDTELKEIGIEISGRRVLQYLEILDNKGFSENLGRKGRRITDVGKEEVGKVQSISTNFVYDRIRSIITEAKFDIERKRGDVVVNLSFISKDKEKKVLSIIDEICTKSSFIPPFIKIVPEGEEIHGREVQKGEICLVTISSVTIDEIILKNGIYVEPYYVTLIEIKDYAPVRCTGIYSCKELTTNPFDLLVERKVAAVYNAINKGYGEIIVDHRYVPYVARTRVIELLRKTVDFFGGLVIIGRREFGLGLKCKENYVDIFATGGELIPAVLEELDVSTRTITADSIINFNELEPVCQVKGEVIEL